MPTTAYHVLRLYNIESTGVGGPNSDPPREAWEIVGTYAGHSDDQALRKHLEANPDDAEFPLVLVPSGNWHRKKATPKKVDPQFVIEDA